MAAVRRCSEKRRSCDIEAARAAGTASVAVLWGYAAPDALLGLDPTIVFRSVEQLREL